MLRYTKVQVLNFVAVHRIDQPERQIPEGMAVWETDTNIGRTYRDLCDVALEDGWSHEMVILQDDVRFIRNPYDYSGGFGIPILAYGQSKREGHVCPRAFSANPEGWERLRLGWQYAEETLCPYFTRALGSDGVVLDWTEHLG